MERIVTIPAILVILLFFSHKTIAQDLEVAGKAKIGHMDEADNADSIVVWQSDSTLAVRDANTLVQFQILSISNDTIFLSDGGYVKLPLDQVNDLDADPTNEIETWSTLDGIPLAFLDGFDDVLSDEQVQDKAGAMASGNTETLITVTYQDGDGTMDYVVEPNLSKYTNNVGFLTSETDGSVTNEKISALMIMGDSLAVTEGIMTMKVAVDSSNTNEIQSLSEVLSQDSLANSRIKNVTDPVDAQDAATKAYVDAAIPSGTSVGDRLMWNGSAWVVVGSTDVMSNTGKIWMDRNLGATQVATSSTDFNSYGDLYQWGRGSDGHQTIVWTSSSTSDGAEQAKETNILSGTDVPGHDDFILALNSPYDWRSPQNDNLWEGVNGTNNPCPAGYRLPTEAEWQAERTSWSSDNAAGAFASPLKLPLAGNRLVINGLILNSGSLGDYWSSTVSGANSRRLFFDSSIAFLSTNSRAFGGSVRCLKD